MPTQQSVKAAITGANERLIKACERRDADGVAACYTPDAQLLPNNSRFCVGVIGGIVLLVQWVRR